MLSVYASETKIDIPKEYLDFPGQKSLLLVAPNGEVVFEQNAHQKRTLASVTKLYTAISALEHWGEDYRFKTQVYRKGDNLYVKGFGDPFFDIHEMRALVDRIRLEVDKIDMIFLDESSFGGVYRVDGQTDTRNPYDAPLSAIAVNFNTIALKKDKSGTIQSNENLVPLTQTAVELGEKYLYRGGRDRMALEQRAGVGARYFGEVLLALLQEAGIAIDNRIQLEKTPTDAQLIINYRNSRTLAELIKPMLRYSTNFIANQLYLAAVADSGEVASVERALEVNAEKLSLGGVDPVIRFVEGAGLSESNVASAYHVVSMLDYWQQHLEYMPEYKDHIFAKTGTLTGTSTLAGFIESSAGLWRFCILLSQPGHKINGKIRRNIVTQIRDQILGASQVGALAE